MGIILSFSKADRQEQKEPKVRLYHHIPNTLVTLRPPQLLTNTQAEKLTPTKR